MCFKYIVGYLLLLFLQSYGQLTMEENDVCFNGEISGICTRISQCEIAVKRITQLTVHSLTRCGFSGLEEIVCCETTGTSTNRTRNSNFNIHDKASRLPIDKRRADIECENLLPALPPSTSSYIVGGENASVGEFPHMVAILRYSIEKKEYKLVCGGSLVTVKWVLTGAHCPVKTVGWKVNIGSILSGEGTDNNETNYKIITVHVHPNYNRRVKYYDIALLELDRLVPITATSFPACLFTSTELPRSNVIVTGWGATEFQNVHSTPVLMKATLDVISNSICRDQYKTIRALPEGIKDDQICAGDYDNHKDTCMGDSGGPLQIVDPKSGIYYVVGVTSFGKQCGSDAAGVYTRVSSHVSWIESVLWP